MNSDSSFSFEAPELCFVLGLLTTVLLLLGVVITGLRARRRVHLSLVACAVVSLLVTIYFAERLGEHYDIASAGTIAPVHLFIAKVTTVFYLAPITTGYLTLRNATYIKFHRVAAYTILCLTILTAATGATMILLAERLPVEGF